MPRTEYAERRARLDSELRARKLDALVVSAAPNIRYLSGFTGSNALLLTGRGVGVLFTDPRYAIQASQESDCAVRVVRGPLSPALVRAAVRRKLRRLGFEQSRITYESYQRLQENLPLGATVEPVGGIIEALRLIKSPAEVAAIRRSVETNSRAFSRAMRKLRTGLTEAAFAAEIDYAMRLEGASGPAFETIVASGAHTALPHAAPRPVAMQERSLVLVDMGASEAGYASDMTRMAFLGSPPARVERLYEAVLEAQLAAVDAVRPGILAAKVDAAARRVLRGHGLDKAFVHSTGHGLGLEIHEPPRLGRRERSALQAGMVVTIEPGAYIEDSGGVRIEDTVLVTERGGEVLTPTSKELFTC